MPRIDLSVLNDYVTANLCADFHTRLGHLSQLLSIILCIFAILQIIDSHETATGLILPILLVADATGTGWNLRSSVGCAQCPVSDFWNNWICNDFG